MLNTCLFIFLETLGLILLVSTTLDFGENILRYSPGSRRLNEWRISNRFWCLHPKIYQSQIFQAGNSAVVSYKMVFFLFVFFFPPRKGYFTCTLVHIKLHPFSFTSTGLTLEYYSTPCMETNRTFTVLHPMFEHATTGVQTKGDNNNNKGQVFKQRVLMW